jgi:hypothetical protein
MEWFLARRRRLAVLALLTAGLCAFNLRSLTADVLDNASTRAELYDLPLLIVSEIAELQTAHPDAEIYLVSNFDYLGGVSDYEFLYNPDRVTVCASARELGGKVGYVIAHDEYTAGVVELDETSDCRSSRTRIHENLIVRCRLG